MTRLFSILRPNFNNSLIYSNYLKVVSYMEQEVILCMYVCMYVQKEVVIEGTYVCT